MSRHNPSTHLLAIAVAALGFGAAFALGAPGALLSLVVAEGLVVRARPAWPPRAATEGAR